MKENKYKDVIIFSFLGLGDFVWATSAISLIKQYDKNIKVTLITFDSFFKLIDTKYLADDVILINNKLFNYKYKLVRYIYKCYWFIKTFFKLYKRETIIFLDISKALGFASKYIYKIKNIIFELIITKKVTNLNMTDINFHHLQLDLLIFGFALLLPKEFHY